MDDKVSELNPMIKGIPKVYGNLLIQGYLSQVYNKGNVIYEFS